MTAVVAPTVAPLSGGGTGGDHPGRGEPATIRSEPARMSGFRPQDKQGIQSRSRGPDVQGAGQEPHPVAMQRQGVEA